MRKKLIYGLFAGLLLFFMVGCATEGKSTAQLTQKATYKITLAGKASEPGVLSYAGYEMNVYKDQASNPCGDCPDQPVSFFVGTSAKEVVGKLAEATKKADDLWDVQETTDSSITLVEKEIGTTKTPEKPSAPAGLAVEGAYTPAR